MAQSYEKAFRETVRRGDYHMGVAELRLEGQVKWGRVHCPEDNGKPLKELSQVCVGDIFKYGEME